MSPQSLLVKGESLDDAVDSSVTRFIYRLAALERKYGRLGMPTTFQTYEGSTWEELGNVGDAVIEESQQLGFSYDRNNAFSTSVIEAVFNALQHGNRGSPDKKVQLLVAYQPGRFATFVVNDEGSPDFAALAGRLKQADESIDRFCDTSVEQSKRGAGMGIMQHYLDILYYDRAPDGLTVMGAIYEPTIASTSPR